MKYFYSLLFAFLFSSNLVAQNAHCGSSSIQPPLTPSPEWAKELLKPSPNVFALDSAYEAYFTKNSYKKDEWTKYYRRWRRLNSSHILPDGSLMNSEQFNQKRKLVEGKKTYQKDQTANWKPIGPVTTHWKSEDNPNMDACPWQANIYCLEIAPSDPNVIYIVTETGSMFRSADMGKSWQARGEAYLLNSEALAVHPTDENTVILGTNDKVRKTTDGGQTWTDIYSANNFWCYRIIINPLNPDIILLSSNKGVIRTTNGGASWNQVLTDDCEDIEFHPTNPDIVYVLKKNTSINFYECWKSTNGGTSFSAKTSGWPTGLTDGDGRIATTPADPSRVYAVLLTNQGPRILRSNNAGESWTVTASGSSASLGMDNGQGYYDLDIVASELDADNIIVATTTAFRSLDGGSNFTPVGGYYGPFPIHPDIQAMRSKGTDTYIATDGGITWSDDFFGSNSEPRSEGIFSTDLWGFDAGWNEDVLVGGRYHNGNTAYHQSYPEGKFLRMGGAEAATGYVNPVKNRQTFFSDIGGYEIPETFDGKTINLPISEWPNESYYYMEYSEMTWSPVCWNHVFIGNGPDIKKSTNNGVSYSTLFTSPDDGAKIEHIRISRTNPNVMYVTQRSNTLWDGKIYKTVNGGVSWTTLPNLPVSSGQRRVMTITLSGENENELWVALAYSSNGNKVFYSPNAGNTWVNWTTDKLNDLNLQDIVHQLGTNGGVYVAAENGKLFYRNKSMTDWVEYNAGLPVNHAARALKPFYRDGKIRSGSNVGFWESELYEDSKLLAQPIADKLESSCARDTFYFDDYSVFRYDGSQQWSWQFPGATTVLGADTRTPKVVYGMSGEYDVTLTISNASGSVTRTVSKMIRVLPSECDVDTIAGKNLKMNGNYKIVSIQQVRGLKDATSMTVMCWIKLADKQQWFTQLVSNWSSNVGFGFGFAFQGYVPTTNLTFSWKDVPYWQTSPFNLELNKWIHVAMTVEPTKVTLYKDGIPWVYNGDFSNFELSETPFEIGGPVYGQGGTFNGDMEEFKIYNKALTQDEIREQMHLIDKTPDQSLVLYYQFNENKPDIVYDRIGQSHGLNGSAQLVTSTAAIGTGVSDRVNIKTNGKHEFSKSRIMLNFPNGNHPNGEMVMTRLYNQPYEAPNATGLSNHYWILENWGTNQTFSGLSDITFLQSGIEAINAKIFARPVYEYSVQNWQTNTATGTQISGGQPGDFNILNQSLISNASQFIIAGVKIKPLADAGEDKSICLGEEVLLQGSGGSVYNWFDESGTLLGTQSELKITPTVSSDYILKVTDLNGESAYDTVSVVVLPVPDVIIIDQQLTAGVNTVINIPGNYSFNWSNGIQGPDFTTPFAGSYSVTITNPESCTQVVTFNVNLDSTSLPSIYLVQAELLGLQQINNSDAYQWYLDDQLLGGATAQTITPPATGFYKTYVHYINGFEATTEPYFYKTTATDTKNGIKVLWSPNPATHTLHFSFENPNGLDLSDVVCKIYDFQGRLLKSESIGNDANINVSNLSPGMYHLKLDARNLKITGTVQIVR